MRKEIIAGNWKMYKTVSETEEFFRENLEGLKTQDREVFFFVPYVSLTQAKKAVENTDIRIGAQNMYYEDEGAYTGEISLPMLSDIGINHVLIGHSERRKYFAETDETVNLKLKKALKENFHPVVCIGEDLEQRESGETFNVLKKQLSGALKDVEKDEKIVIAYEPVWAIGTGKTATEQQAEEALKKIRDFIRELYDDDFADSIRILYGGSVKPKNIKALMALEDVDGVLVGGASLKSDFVSIVQYDR